MYFVFGSTTISWLDQSQWPQSGEEKNNMELIFSQSSSVRSSVGQRSPDLPLHLMSVN